MLSKKAAFLLFFCLLFIQQAAGAETIWQPLNEGINDLDIRSVSVFSRDDNLICASSEKQVYLSQQGGNLWHEIFSLGLEDEAINLVLFDSANPQRLYLASTKGLFATDDQGGSWQRLFGKVSEAATKINCIALDCRNQQRVYIGTDRGLYLSSDSGINWRKINSGLPDYPISSIAVHPDNSQVIYLANSLGVFKSPDAARSWRRIYVSSHKISDEESQEEDLLENRDQIRWIEINQKDPENIFIATDEGIVVSADAGESWQAMPAQGLTNDDVNFIVYADRKQHLYAATEDGLFEFSRQLNIWQNIYSGLTAQKVRYLALNKKQSRLFAATDKGIFKTTQVEFARREKDKVEYILEGLAQNEPAIRQVQEAALKYAEVIDPQRIKTLRRSAKLKALLPDIRVDYDKTVTYDGGSDKYYVGPYDWGLTFSWDVGDLIFSEQVRLIDSQTRLAVQLRDDLLDEVTRLYYERRKLQTDLVLNPPKDTETNLDKTLRLEELTANIDALTGGYFSGQLKE